MATTFPVPTRDRPGIRAARLIEPREDAGMRVLVLGGTWFVGGAVVDAALARGWEVTTFNRGRSRPDVPGTTAVHRDRTNAADLKRLAAGGAWDLMVDTSGQEPWIVGMSAHALRDVAERYASLSSVTVYPDWPDRPVDETSAVRPSSATLRASDPAAGSGRDATAR
jgi:nucleoside-diphosphate-sugar epimerase